MKKNKNLFNKNIIKFNKSEYKKNNNNKGYGIFKKRYIEKVNYNLNYITYKNLFNKGFIKLNKINLKKSIFQKSIQINFNNTKYISFILTSITSLSKKLGESFVKVPFMFFSNSISYSSVKYISKKI